MSATHSPAVVYTIGHSNHSADDFAGLLERHAIEVIADVRSQPHSRRFPQFGRRRLQEDLDRRGIGYLFLGKELGGKRDDPSLIERGRISYDLISRTPDFQGGLRRVRREAGRARLALMCAEREPLDCHRTLLVARHLKGDDVRICHILADGRIEEHEETERRLLSAAGQVSLPLLALLEDRERALARAYAIRSGAIQPARLCKGVLVREAGWPFRRPRRRRQGRGPLP